MFFKIGSFLLPWLLVATGVYLLSGSVIHLLEASLIGVGTFMLGMRAYAYLKSSMESQMQQMVKQVSSVDMKSMFEQLQKAMPPMPPPAPPTEPKKEETVPQA